MTLLDTGELPCLGFELRFSFYSTSLTSFGNSTSTSLGGLAFAMPEIYVEARNIKGSGVSLWAGSRLYRGPDIHIADHFYFNDHSGQGFGVEFKNTRLSTVFVASTDTTSTVPPYFYLNIKTGTPSTALRQRLVVIGEQDFKINENNSVTLLGEFHRMADADGEVEVDSVAQATNFPSDYGFVVGVKHQHQIKKMLPGSFNDFSAYDYNKISKIAKVNLMKRIEKSSLKSNAKNRLISELSKMLIVTNSLGWTLKYNGNSIYTDTDLKL